MGDFLGAQNYFRNFQWLFLIITYNYMNNTSIDDFHFNSVIGKGTYAKVCLVTRKKDEKLFALKVLKKKYII